MRSPAVPETLKHQLPAAAIARLAAAAEAQAALAATIEVELKHRASSAGTADVSDFDCSARLLKKAAAGIAAAVIAHNPRLVGDIRSDVTARLVKLGVPPLSAQAVTDQMESRHQIGTVPQTDQQRHDHFVTVLNALKFLDGRL